MRSFRLALALRTGLGVLVLFLILGSVMAAGLRALLYRQLDGTLLHLAEVEAEAGAAQVGPEFSFHEGILQSSRTNAGEALTRFAQLWSSDGRPLVRSANLRSDLTLPSLALVRAEAGQVTWETHVWHGQRMRCVVYPLLLLGVAHGHHLLQVAAPLTPLDNTLRAFILFLLGLSLLAAAGAFGIGWRLAKAALKPTYEITAQAEAIRDGTPSPSITAHAGVAEFARLVQVLNAMLARLDEASNSQRRFTADASHELRGPLTALRGELDLALRRERTPEEYRTTLDRCRKEVIRLSRLAADLLTLARSEASLRPQDRFDVDLREVAGQVASRYRALAEEREVQLQVNGPPVSLRGDPGMIERIISNLVDNALKHSPRQGLVEVTIVAGDPATVTVRDSGPGVPPLHQPLLFTRFFRPESSATPGERNGLGLAIARTAAEAHGGQLEFEGNQPGASFRLTLPLAGSR